MEVNVLLFGILTDKIGKSSIIIKDIDHLDDLVNKLKESYKQIEGLQFAIAVNQEIVRENVKLKDKDEIALLPAFSGG